MKNRLRGLLIVALGVAATSLAASELPPAIVRPSAVPAAQMDGHVVPPRWLQQTKAPNFPFMVMIDERTGKVCQVTPTDGCSETGESLPGSRSAPDVEGLQIVLLQSFASGVNESARAPTRWYVTVTRTDEAKGDPSPLVLGMVHIWNVSLAAGSQFPGDDVFLNGAPGAVLHYTIDKPERRADGTYSVGYSYSCGTKCGASFTASMVHDAQGWHIVSTTAGPMA
jgi:hypothetical protein